MPVALSESTLFSFSSFLEPNFLLRHNLHIIPLPLLLRNAHQYTRGSHQYNIAKLLP